MSKTSKSSPVKTIIFLVLSVCVYLLIFSNIEQLNQFYLSKDIVPALCLLGTIIGVAFLYGTAISYTLSLFGLESDH